MTRTVDTTPDTAGDARSYWTRVLHTGGATAAPRWTTDPRPGTAVHDEPLPPGALAAVAAATDAGPDAALLAAHAAVLAALSGDAEVTAGVPAVPGGPPLPVPLAVTGTWADLVGEAQAAIAGLRAHPDVDPAALAAELGTAVPDFGTVLDPVTPGDRWPGALGRSGARGHAADRPATRGALRIVPAGDRLRLEYRLDHLDAAAAARIAGYHGTALALAAAGPDAPVRPSALVGSAERTHQLDELAGRPRPLPDRRAHRLLADRTATAPDEIVAEHAGVTLTRAELDARANRVARTLRSAGVEPEDVVAVVTERDLDWLVAVLAVLRAGAAYLPVEPHFPPERIARTLGRAGCRRVLTSPGSRENLDAAALAAQVWTVAEAVVASDDASDPGVDVPADALAYLYFTSGSTGEPKGAMCEHAGMLNHLLAKIEDLELGEGCVVAQTAPQCFDISLWQLLAGPLAGGRTLLVEQDTILDVRRFVSTLADHRVTVAQLVPSYLEVVLTYLEQHPTPLPDLRMVSATGEALKKELVERWFRVLPGVPLVNAYGLTETSDDTNHAVLRSVPDGDRIPLGPPVPGVRVYVVDPDLMPVPLGAPGEIVFSGVCVGRGYVNDPERTAAAFGPDPHRPGERLYRSGDHGRWRPDGQLEFLGRRDNQVKIRGFRIEIGEIENALLRVPGVRDACVVVAAAHGGPQLVAFHAGEGPDQAQVQARLAQSLPAYMVPAAVHRLDRLPVTPNGKIDRKALAARAATAPAAPVPSPADGGTATAAQQRVLDAVARVLDLPAVSPSDHFVELGGSSLSAVKLVIALDRAVTVREVLDHPVLSDLAGLLPAGPN
ncbi:non-ribosomal peptide synthetase [Pseudonocardia parietis]|uniref:Amino acid adenylation domain-containing protein n=1 Tax=Pseudonocardia parietis TaxID=570936 RepID=A0ABS4VYB4_9PSEU|nr:non-ribosomal peptide synthetase [Pseudonocardia parietis]MBP2368912.1 amino acid adenylation domain-containing protein [Pseudonocardia parietis]